MEQEIAPPLSEEHVNMLEAYRHVVNEIRGRAETVERISRAWFSGFINMQPREVEEFGYLNLRFIYELLVMGCLIAHNDINAQKGKQSSGEMKVSRGLKILEKLNPDFFPIPVPFYELIDGQYKPQPTPTPYLTREELPKLHGMAGNWLHRNNFARYLQRTEEPNLIPILEEIAKIQNLIARHKIKIADSDLVIWVTAKGENGLAETIPTKADAIVKFVDGGEDPRSPIGSSW